MPATVDALARPAEAPQPPFSDELEAWLKSDGDKTLGGLGDVFAENAFAVTAMLLMFVPALPLPTAGISHLFEVITILIGAQMVSGVRKLWLPKRWKARALGSLTTDKAVPMVMRWTRRFERLSRRRGARLLESTLGQRVVGLLLIGAAVSALVAPPFSGLDTLPGMGAVIICLGFVLRDIVIAAVGTAFVIAGAALIVTIGAALAHSLLQIF